MWVYSAAFTVSLGSYNMRNLLTEINYYYQNKKLTPSIIGLINGVQMAISIFTTTLKSQEIQGTLFD